MFNRLLAKTQEAVPAKQTARLDFLSEDADQGTIEIANRGLHSTGTPQRIVGHLALGPDLPDCTTTSEGQETLEKLRADLESRINYV